jgi:hypothetical protein
MARSQSHTSINEIQESLNSESEVYTCLKRTDHLIAEGLIDIVLTTKL